MKIQQKRHPQQASSAFMVILFHSFIIGFVIQLLVPFYWVKDVATDTNLLYFALFSAIYSFILAFFSSLKVYKTGALPFKYMLHVTLYSVFLIVMAQSFFNFSPAHFTDLPRADVRNFIKTLAFTLIIVMIMAYISWKVWDKWRQIKHYD